MRMNIEGITDDDVLLQMKQHKRNLDDLQDTADRLHVNINTYLLYILTEQLNGLLLGDDL